MNRTWDLKKKEFAFGLKRIILMSVLFLVAISGDSSMCAEELASKEGGSIKDSGNKWGVGYRYRYVHPDDEDLKNQGGHSNNLNLTYRAFRNLALELEGGHFELESNSGTTIDVISLHAAVQLIANFSKIKPYLVSGIGFQYYDREKTVGNTDAKESSFSYKAGPGIEYFLNKNCAINLEGVYIYGNTGVRDSLDVYGWQFGGGMKFYF